MGLTIPPPLNVAMDKLFFIAYQGNGQKLAWFCATYRLEYLGKG